MKMTWTEPRAVLRMEAETPDDLDTISILTCGVLLGTERLYATSADHPLYESDRGQRSFIRSGPGGSLLVGLVWDIRNQPNAGRPKSDADARKADATQAIGQALHEVVRFVVAQAQADLALTAAGVAPVNHDVQK